MSVERRGRHDTTEKRLTLDGAVLAYADCFVRATLRLCWMLHPAWLVLAAFAGVNMVQPAFAGIRPAAMLVHRPGLDPGAAFG